MTHITQELLKLPVLELEQTPNLTLLDVARELRRIGRGMEADYYLSTIPVILYQRGINLEDSYTMTMGEITFELSKPIAPEGWDNNIWGKSIVCPQ